MESDDCDDAISDSRQDRPTQDTLASDCPVRETRAKIYTGSTRSIDKRWQREISAEDATTLLQDRIQ